MMSEEWFDDWDVESLHAKEVSGCDTCVEGSPIPDSGIVCGPVLRLIQADYDNFVYTGSILIITKNNFDADIAPVVSYTSGPASSDVSVKGFELTHGQFNSKLFHVDQLGNDSTFQFYRYSIELPILEYEQMIKYSVDDEFKVNYRFFIPSRSHNFNTIAYSCNGFSLGVDTTVFKGSLWYDILRKHSKVRYNVMLGGGDQIYSDSIKLYSEEVGKWLATSDPIKRYATKVTPEFRKEMENFYLKEYIEWYGFGHWKGITVNSKTTQNCFTTAISTIPSINIWDDHDIIDGFGSYNDTFMKTDVFSSIGKAAYKYYMLFQHHVSMDEKDDREAYLSTPQWVLGNEPGAYIGEKSHSVVTRIGPTMAMLGLDCRTERKLKEIVSPQTYDIVFQRLQKEAERGKLDHLLVMLGVPIAYPRLVWLEWLFSSKLLAPLKYLSKKGLFARGLVNDFNGDVELLDDLNDHWCARHHKKERNHLISRLQDFGAKNGIRITILSGDVHLASVGRFRSKLHLRHLTNSKEETNKEILYKPENDVRLMINIISSAVVNTPPPDAMAILLQKRAHLHTFDFETQEDTVPLFEYEVDGKTKRPLDSFLNKRNWSDVIPVKNALENSYLREILGIKLNDLIMPGIVSDKKKDKVKITDSHQAYPVVENGVLASIHVEKDTKDTSSQTAWYMLPIPDLQKTEMNLSHKNMKHLAL